MPPGRKTTPANAVRQRGKRFPDAEARAVLDWLKHNGTARTREGMSRYAIPSDRAFGVPVGTLRELAKRLGRDHELAAALWETGWYEARMLASFVDEPGRVTPAQMDRWCADFDSWAICDTVCFHLFDRTPHAWRKVRPWSRRHEEFVKRAAFALIWSLAADDRIASDDSFLSCLPLIEKGAQDDRNFVKKGVDMALRAIGKRNLKLNAAAIEVAERMAGSAVSVTRRVGRTALKELASPAAHERLTRRANRGG